MRDDAQLVGATRSGDPDAFGLLVQRWFDPCWEVAWRILHDRDLAADIAQEAVMTAWQQLDRLERPASFGGWILRIARNRALDRLGQERRATPTGDDHDLELRRDDPPLADPEVEHARGEEHDLVWAAAAALGERDSSLLDLHLRHGLEPHEIAEELGIAPNAAHQALFRLRKRLGTAIRAWLLWTTMTRNAFGHLVEGVDPACPELRENLRTAGIDRFDPTAVKVIDGHVASCELCADQQERVAAPATLFSAAPLVAVPAALREQTLARISQAGIPVAAEPDPDLADLDHPPTDTTEPRQSKSTSPDIVRGKTRRRRRWSQATAALVAAATVTGLWMWAAWPPTPNEPAVADTQDGHTPQPSPSPDIPPADGPRDTPGDEFASVDDASADDDRATASPPESPPLAPDIRRFDLDAEPDQPCPRGGLEHLISWEVVDAHEVTLTAPAAEPRAVAATGHLRMCAGWATTFVLTATGPGGTATASRSTSTAPDPKIIEFTVHNRGPLDVCQPPGDDAADATAEPGSATEDEDASVPRDRDLTAPSQRPQTLFLYDLAWTSRYAHTATMTQDDGLPEPVDTTTQVQRCAPNGTTFTLHLTGDGGTTTATRSHTLTPQ